MHLMYEVEARWSWVGVTVGGRENKGMEVGELLDLDSFEGHLVNGSPTDRGSSDGEEKEKEGSGKGGVEDAKVESVKNTFG